MTDIYDISSAPSARMCDFGRRLEAGRRELTAEFKRGFEHGRTLAQREFPLWARGALRLAHRAKEQP